MLKLLTHPQAGPKLVNLEQVAYAEASAVGTVLHLNGEKLHVKETFVDIWPEVFEAPKSTAKPKRGRPAKGAKEEPKSE